MSIEAIKAQVIRLLDYLCLSNPRFVSSLGAIAASILVIRRLQQSKHGPKIPGPFLNSFSNLPLFWHAFRGRYNLYSTHLHQHYNSGLVRIGHNRVSLADPSELRRVLATHNFTKGSTYEGGLILTPTAASTTDPELNKTRRRQYGTAYSLASIKALEDTVVETGVLSLMQTWDKQLSGQDSVTINYYFDFHRMAVDVIGKLGFGKSFGGLASGSTAITDAVSGTLVLAAVEGQLPFLKYFRWLWPSLPRARQYLLNAAYRAIAERKATDPSVAHFDILQKLMDARDPATGELLEGDDLASEVISMMLAGTDTTSTTLSFIIMNLMNHPLVYKQLVDEVTQTFPQSDHIIGFDEVRRKLPYMHAVILESMRLTPVASGLLSRRVPANTVLLEKYQLKDDDEIFVSFFACHHNPQVWDSPERFDPGRFMEGDSETRAKDILPFSTGVRVCLGRNLAWLELYTTLANIIHKYEFKLPKDSPYGPHVVDKMGYPKVVPCTTFFNCKPANPQEHCRVRISRRKLKNGM